MLPRNNASKLFLVALLLSANIVLMFHTANSISSGSVSSTAQQLLFEHSSIETEQFKDLYTRLRLQPLASGKTLQIKHLSSSNQNDELSKLGLTAVNDSSSLTAASVDEFSNAINETSDSAAKDSNSDTSMTASNESNMTASNDPNMTASNDSNMTAAVNEAPSHEVHQTLEIVDDSVVLAVKGKPGGVKNVNKSLVKNPARGEAAPILTQTAAAAVVDNETAVTEQVVV